MNVIRYNPWGVMDRLHRDVDRLFSARLLSEHGDDVAELSDWAPAVDIKEEDNRFLIRADVPGVAAEAIEITMDGGTLSLQGRRETTSEEEKDGLRRVERVSGRFYRRFALPDTADAEGIKADCKDGVLEISIPKQAKSQPRRIQITSA
ncbi:MAG TPA: Hsp20/alpha crystallin family protein [Gammaproteobacteria bacterium]